VAEIRLSDYLTEAAERRFDWRDRNCFLFCADWLVLSRGRDPAAAWRGQFHDRREAMALLKREGGPIALACKAMAAIGASATDKPKPGDVALVMGPIGRKRGRIIKQPTGAICLNEQSFAVLTIDCGLVIAPMALHCAWTIG